MTKSILTIFLLNALTNHAVQAEPAMKMEKKLTSVKEVCDITKNLGHFQHKGRLFIDDKTYKISCGRLNLSSTGAVERSSLELLVLGKNEEHWDRVKLTLNTDIHDAQANAAFREAAFRLISGETQNHSKKSNAFDITYGETFFENINAGDYSQSIPVLDSQYRGSIMREYNGRGGDRVTLELYYNSSYL